MSTRYKNGSHYENHQRAAELHDGAEHAHRSAAEAAEKQDYETGHEQSRQALEHSQQAHELSGELQRRSFNEHGFAKFGHDDIAALAYKLWQARGCPEDSADEDWFRAAEELRDRKERNEK
jgi:hypothetical protein